MSETATSSRLIVDDGTSVGAVLLAPSRSAACYVVAHGAGAGMDHPFMKAVAEGLEDRGLATFRYQFPAMERGSRRTDTPAVAQATVRAACVAAHQATGLPLVAGGKSFGGRMTSQAQAASPLPEVMGLAFLGFPLHPAGKPSRDRAAHLAQVRAPMLFLQGTRDKLAELDLLEPVVADLRPRAQLRLIDQADHGFDVLKRSGRLPDDVLAEVLDALAGWASTVVGRRR